MKSKRCCFTGHRPEKLSISEKEAKKLLEVAIRKAIGDGYLTFITGMARGIDMWAGEIVIRLRKHNSNIHLICTPPYEGFESNWNESDKRLYHSILKKSDYTKYICEKYSTYCFQTRNIYMVDYSKRVIAAYNGKSGGTKNTIDYATKKEVEVINILDTSNVMR